MSDPRTASEFLGIDAHTFKDLEIFESDTGNACLFDFCNLSRTAGGAAVLRQRMERPWSDAARIHATQGSLVFITAQRQVFSRLPSVYAIGGVELYTREILPAMDYRNWFDFTLGAFQIWFNHDSHYFSIMRGVQAACRLVQALRVFVAQAELAALDGELVPLVQEMRVLLARPKISRVPDYDVSGWGTWRILRLDQVLRIQEKPTIFRLLELIHAMDALIAMADATSKYGFVMPQIEEGELRVHGQGLVHPYLEEAVANPVELDQAHRILFLTGPNMAGKTTYLRAFATALYLAHLGMGVPARSFCFVPVQRLFSSISLTDDLRNGISYFRAEALRMKAVAEAIVAGEQVVALMDEPFKGTNVKDAFDASLAILERFSARENCLFMFSSHHIELSEHLDITAGQVDCRYFEAQENEGRLRFDYLLRPGISSQRLGMRVLREEGIFELLDGDPVDKNSRRPAHATAGT